MINYIIEYKNIKNLWMNWRDFASKIDLFIRYVKYQVDRTIGAPTASLTPD